MSPAAFGLGIDFGTSNTVAMLRWPDGRVKPLLFEGSPLLPSAVFAPAGSALVVGSDALHRGRFEPVRLVPNPKRHIDEAAVLLADREVSVVDLVAAVLRHVGTEAVRVAGGFVPTVALAHPAGWGPVRRGVLVDAAQAAGLGEPLLVPEPTAAANYFTAVLNRDLAVGKALVVYDLGAGTFDASVVVSRDDGFEVVAVDGLDDVGGLDIDAAIVKRLRDEYGPRQPEAWRRLTDSQQPEDLRQRRMLWDDVRVAKEMLSRAPAVLLRLPPLETDVQLTRDEFEAMAEPLIARTMRTVVALTRFAGVGGDEIAGLLLVGGSSRVPLVATLLHRTLGIAPIVTEQPELVVSEGTLQSIPPVAEAPPASVPPLAPAVTPVAASAPVSPPAGVPVSVPPAPANVPPQSADLTRGTLSRGTLYVSGQYPIVSPRDRPAAPEPPPEPSRVIPLWTVPPEPAPLEPAPLEPAPPEAVPPEAAPPPEAPRPRRRRGRIAVALAVPLAAALVAVAVVVFANSAGGQLSGPPPSSPSGTTDLSVTGTTVATGTPLPPTTSISATALGSAQTTTRPPAPGTPVFKVDPAELAFPDTGLGGHSQSRKVVVRSSGDAELAVLNVQLGGANQADFAIDKGCRQARLSAGATCAVVVTFTPQGVGSRTAYLTLAHNASGSPTTVSITGKGVKLPDLVPTEDLSTGGNLKVVVINQGQADAGPSVMIIEFSTGPQRLAVPAVPAGSRVLVWGYTTPDSCLPPSPCALTLKADVDNQVAEANETNNVKRVSLRGG